MNEQDFFYPQGDEELSTGGKGCGTPADADKANVKMAKSPASLKPNLRKTKCEGFPESKKQCWLGVGRGNWKALIRAGIAAAQSLPINPILVAERLLAASCR